MGYNKQAHDRTHGNCVVFDTPDIPDLEDMVEMRRNRHIARPLIDSLSKGQKVTISKPGRKMAIYTQGIDIAIYLRTPPGSTIHRGL